MARFNPLQWARDIRNELDLLWERIGKLDDRFVNWAESEHTGPLPQENKSSVPLDVPTVIRDQNKPE